MAQPIDSSAVDLSAVDLSAVDLSAADLRDAAFATLREQAMPDDPIQPGADLPEDPQTPPLATAGSGYWDPGPASREVLAVGSPRSAGRLPSARAAVAAVALLLAATLVAGFVGMGPATALFGDADGDSAAAATKTSARARPAGKAAPSVAALRARVRDVTLKGSDVGNRVQVKVIPHGDSVKGQVTLANCGYRFTTESHRVARRQVAILDRAGRPTGGSHEVVAYATEAQAAKALREWRASMDRCRLGKTFRVGTDATPVRYRQVQHSGARQLPARDNDVARMTVTTAGRSQPVYVLTVVQRHGQVLSALAVVSPRPLTTADVAAAMAIGKVTGTRLVAAPKRSTGA